MEVSRRILIVDDDVDTVRMLALLMTAAGSVTQTVTDARIGLDAFAELQPQMVVLDLSMPGMDAFDLLRKAG